MGIIATYEIKHTDHVERVAEKIAHELTVGTWTELNHLEQYQLQAFRGEVIATSQQETTSRFSIRYPLHNVTPDFSSILTTTFGKLSLDPGVQLVDLSLPEELAPDFPGAAFGVEGVRDILRVHDRPLAMSIFKGVIGRDLDFLATQLRDQFAGGIDLVKDDEILYDNPLTPSLERARIGASVIREHKETTGRSVLYAVTLSGPVFTLLDQAKRLMEAGATALLFNVYTYGLDALRELAKDPEIHVPILAHPAFAGALTGSVRHSLLFGKLIRLAGADLTLFPSPYGSLSTPKDEAQQIQTYATEPHWTKPILTVPSAGIHPGLVPDLIRDFGSDVVINAGGGIHGHPDGAADGARAFRQAIDQAIGKTSETDALSTALDAWGAR
ncbi:2,3-diketo-5-methylthiopentyl-1-phosphate enolase (DK-MTP-1-P enolase) [Exiguobacterium sp. 8H]|uniref:2,3-diketo-5-methylthiopentyl-1-phosphate enolase n=1 Tax=unclassified Exiguobacterium TaxID=2644629 RepID=UPI0012F014B2|nr:MULTISPECIES: 2,3-diketo-5-methylthiopentyl-1-phosphate enolase [unclassified Exiguobacterium]MCV9900449.1 2,3-diketo-5-methylthiopentyl-1-phosphate enolase [Exiguobacterium sp. N5]VXB69306.1 2,3-diketo-5-methylthiopentyl-1-phosphate enolase (DK-MTP-1-P enolase) [Exiguobacterium sp. 8A]VXB70573.1 2,3-diketo-5-methylthiopentyl-1-phosphate enolase (DK-MTP-1-P enolase) [Exiguobacterium sp. 8H]